MFRPSFPIRVFLALSLAISIFEATSPTLNATSAELPPVVENIPLPASISLCGEPLPLEDPHVREMLDREFTISVWDRAQVFMWLKRAGKYFPHIEGELAKAGLPNDLKYLAVAESSLLPHVRSSAGANGLWQFMPETGRRFGLKKVHGLDERREYQKSTKAAIDYLTILYNRFGSWSLAMAAYNCGEKRVGDAIKEQRVDSYFRLDLPLETERYVYRIAAIKIILQDPERYGYRIDPSHIYSPLAAEIKNVRITNSIRFTDLAREFGIDYKTLKEMNPHIVGSYLPPGQYDLKVPAGNGVKVASALQRLSSVAPKNTPREERHYVVRRGDTLSRIAATTGVAVSTLKSLNRIKGDVIHVGQRLRLH